MFIFSHRAFDDIFCEEESTVSEIKLEDFISCIGGTFREILAKNKRSHEVS